jgi:hypothetical protein
MIREKQVRIHWQGQEQTGTISYYSPFLMKKRREAEVKGQEHMRLMDLKSFDIASILIAKEEVLAEGRGYDHYDSFCGLQEQIGTQEGKILACGNCKYFLFSGMARDMSNGSRGYCLHGKLGQNLRPRDIREIFHCCEYFQFGPRDAREEFRRRWKTSLIERPLDQRPRLGKQGEGLLPSDLFDDRDSPPSA